MTVSLRAVRDAAFWDDTICTNCGATGGEARYACFHCDEAEVLPAKIVLQVCENVEREEEDDET